MQQSRLGGRILDSRTVRFGSDGTQAALFTLAGTGAGAGRQSSIFDLGAYRPWSVSWQAQCEFATAPVLGETVDLYIVRSSDSLGTIVDGDLGAVDAAIATIDTLRNLARGKLGSLVAQTNLVTPLPQSSGDWVILARYIIIAAWNYSALDALSGTAANNFVDLTFHLGG